jgi:murein L,D-transpeptidase YafK
MRRIWTVFGVLAASLAGLPSAEAKGAKPYPGVTVIDDQTAELTPADRPFAGRSARQPFEKADRVVVLKSERKLVLMRGDRVIEAYTVALGRYPVGHKQREGDERTPEGVYTLDQKLPKSLFYKAIHISYPNPNDLAQARRLGAKPGSRIEIHGLPNDWDAKTLGHPMLDWTNGCIAVTNREMDQIWAMVDPGTPIEIFP